MSTPGQMFAALCHCSRQVRDRTSFVAFERVRLVEAQSPLVAEYEFVGYVGAAPQLGVS